MYTSRTPEESLRDEIKALSQEIMWREYISLKVQGFSLKESFVEKSVQTKVNLKMSNAKAVVRLSGQGVGVVDSVYKSYSQKYTPQYKSLSKIALESFCVSVKSRVLDKTESIVNVTVEFKNSHGRVVPFRASSLCLTRSAVMSLNEAFEYYINFLQSTFNYGL